MKKLLVISLAVALALGMLVPMALPVAAADPGPVLAARWLFNEGSGATTVADISGNGNTGTVVGATTGVAGKFGNALSFDGVNNYVSVADSAILHFTSQTTFEAWIYPEGYLTSGIARIESRKGGTFEVGIGSTAGSGGIPQGNLTLYTPEMDWTDTGAHFDLSHWYHVAVVFDGTYWKAYVDGSLVWTSLATTIEIYDDLYIGTRGFMSEESFKGIIDEVRIWNGVLTASQLDDMLPPTIMVTTPSDGATYILNQSVNADWSVADSTGSGSGSGVTGVDLGETTATTANGLPINMSTVGSHSFTVSAKDYARNATTKTVNYNVYYIPTVSVTWPDWTYDGTAHQASGFAYGVGGTSDVLTPAVTFSYVGTGTTTYGPTSTAPTDVGTYEVTASFAGNTDYVPASNTADVTVTQATASITIDAVTLSQNYGFTMPVTATTGPTDLSYSVTYSGISPTVYATSGTPPTNAGCYTVVATITNPNYIAATDSEILVVAPASLTITANDKTNICGTTFTFEGTTEFTPTGLINSDAVNSVTLTSLGASSSAPVGTYPIVPSAAVGAVGTDLSNYTIAYVNGTMTVIPPPNGKSPMIILSAHPNPSDYGQSVTFNVAVFGGIKNGIPTGSVTFKNGTAVLGTGILDKFGSTSIKTSALPVGKDTITAAYSGDSVYTSGTSFRAVVELVQYDTTMTLNSAPNPSTLGGLVLFTAQVYVTSPGTGPLTGGSVIFYDGSKSIGTSPVSSSGAASLSYRGLSAGYHSIRAVYSGNGNYESCRSNTVTQKVIGVLTITTTKLPNGHLGVAYSTTFRASYGSGSYTWLQTSGALPTGLSLSSTGVISGKPTKVGTYNFNVQVNDGVTTASKAVSIIITR